MADAVADKLSSSLRDFGQSIGNAAAARQNIVVRALIQRSAGVIPTLEGVDDYAAAVAGVLKAGESLDQTLDQLSTRDPDSYARILGAFNSELSKYPFINLSSVSARELAYTALPAIPDALFEAKDTDASNNAAIMEQANYPMTGSTTPVAGLGFFQALLLPLGEACGTAIVAVGAATAGVGAIVVGVGCVLAAVAIVAGSIYLATRGLDALVDLFSQDVAASKAETERLKALTSEHLALDKLTAGLTPEQKTAVINGYGAQGVKQPEVKGGLPWGLIATVAAGVGLYLYWPKLVGKAQAFRASQSPAVAGLRRRRRRVR